MSKLVHRMRGLPGLLGVAVPAAVAAHCLGYELAGRLAAVFGPVGGAGGHVGVAGHSGHAELSSIHGSHLAFIPLTSGALFVVASAVLAAVVAVRRATDIPRITLGGLVVTQIVVMAVLEFAGLLGSGTPAAGPVLLALMAQVPVAVVAFTLCRHVRQMVVHLVRSVPTRRLASVPPAVGMTTADVRPALLMWALSCPQRGPPAVGGL